MDFFMFFYLPILKFLECTRLVLKHHVVGSVLESKDMGAILRKKGKEMLEKEKIFENLGKNL